MLLEALARRIRDLDFDVVDRVAYRAFVQTTKMIYEANHRPDAEKGDLTLRPGSPAAKSGAGAAGSR